ncbi:hypothetical protein UK12_28050 [Saccharothrix sp. ST-888]|nr:hypothetical protein UK12_28050 [Saccharothrix sp. ST-888]
MDDPNYSGLARGYIESASMVMGSQRSPTNPQGSYSLSFLYNPSTVSVSHSLSAGEQMIPPYLRQATDTGIPLRTSGGGVSFSLLFDRTYEVWSGRSGDLAHDLGVLLDVHVLYGLTGITTPLSSNQAAQLGAPLLGPPSGVPGSPYGTGATSTGSDSASLQNALSVTPNAVTGTMQMYPVWAVFAAVSGVYTGGSAQALPDISLMRYFGYISSINVEYTHFSQRLVPFRCAVGISLQLMASAGYQ